MTPYRRIIAALNEWRAACGLSLLASELDAADAAEAAERLVADWKRLDKACQNAYQQANHARAELEKLNSELNGVVAARNELHDENSALRSELAEARADRSRARARVESYTATLLDINDVLVQAKVGAPGEDPNIVDIVKALVAERDKARDDAKWQAKYEDMAGTLHRMVKLYLTKEVCQ